jgi:hypothetical protein
LRAKAFAKSDEVGFALALDEDLTAQKPVLDAIERRCRLASIGAWAGALFCVFPVRLVAVYLSSFYLADTHDVTPSPRRIEDLKLATRSNGAVWGWSSPVPFRGSVGVGCISYIVVRS